MLELLDVNKIGFDWPVMLILHLQYLYSEHLPSLSMHALFNHPMSSFAQLLLKFKHLLKRIFWIA
jgi:hypothetical protein